jgi:hypothetical protein
LDGHQEVFHLEKVVDIRQWQGDSISSDHVRDGHSRFEGELGFEAFFVDCGWINDEIKPEERALSPTSFN